MTTDIPYQENTRTAFEPDWNNSAQKTLIAFANGIGGDLFFGVNANDKTWGLTRNETRDIERAAIDFCRTGVEPVLTDLVSMSVIPVAGGQFILKVSVMPGNDRPYAFLGKRYTGGAYVRDGASSFVASEEEIRSMIRESTPSPWEGRLSRSEVLTFEEATEVFGKHSLAFTTEQYCALHLTNEQGDFLRLAELLSDQNPTQIVLGIFSDDQRRITTKTFTGSIVRQVEEILTELQRLNPATVQKTGALAASRSYDWPPAVLREALINSVVHRDYDNKEPTKISVFKDRIECLSYGGIYGGYSVDDIIVEGMKSSRNESLAAIFQRLNWMKNNGSGLTMIRREYANTGVEPKLEASRRIFRAVLPRIVPQTSKKLIEKGGALFKAHETLSTPEIMSLLQMSRTSANTIVNTLMKKKMIEKTGSGRATRYKSLIR